MLTSKNREFCKSIIDPDSILDTTIEWIKSNLDPEDVFDDPALEAWAKNRGFIEEEG